MEAKSKSGRRERGLALITVLWAVVLLSALATSFSASTRTGMDLARNTVQNARAEALADAGLQRAILDLIRSAGSRLVQTGGSFQTWEFDSGVIRFTIQDETGKFDLNRTPPKGLATVFIALGVAPDVAAAIADSIADYRDRDHDTLPYGAEDDVYLTTGAQHGAKDGPFEHLAELRKVFGMTSDLFDLIAPTLTVHGASETPDFTKSPPVIQDLVAEGALVASPSEGVAEGTGFGLGGGGTPRLQASGNVVDEGESDLGSTGRDLVSFQSAVYSIHAEGRTDTGVVFVREALVGITSEAIKGFVILDWRQGQRRLFAAK